MKSILRLSQCRPILILVFLALIFSGNKTYATHAAGSDIRYTCLGGLTYKVTVTFYRDCGGVAEPSNISVNYKSTTAGVNSNFTANKISGTGQEITVPCASSSSSCTGGSSTGIRKFVYEGTVTLPSARADWVFSYSVCCRNCVITTIVNPCAANSTLYVEAKLNNILAPCNSSPNFSNIPIAFVCVGQNFNYNHGVLDPDGDSLAYQLIAPKLSATSSVVFIPPASITSPIASSTPFVTNPATGDLNFTPSAIQIGVLALLVQEYRNGQLIGSVIRDMQVYTTACSNNLPTATGINGTNNFSLTACPGQQVCFTINTADSDASQVVTLTTNNGIPNATYTVSSGNRPTLTFCWTPGVNDIDLLPKTFTVTVRDNACPNNGIQTYSYSIYVPSPYITVSSTNLNCGNSNNGTATATPVYSGTGLSYQWNTGATSSGISNLSPGTYTVTVTDVSGCSVVKSTTITAPPVLNVSEAVTQPSCQNVCNGNIDVTVTGGVAPYSYAWSNGQTTQDLNNQCAGTYTLTVTDANNCKSTKTVTLTNSYTFTATASATNISCYGQNTGSISITPAGGTTPITYGWNNGATSQNLTNINAGNYTVTVTDNKGCTAIVSATVSQPASALSSSVNKTDVLCFGNSTGSASVTASGGTSPYTYLWSNGITTNSNPNLSAGNYTVTVTDSKGCTSVSSVQVLQPLSALNATTNSVNILCFGNSTGSASVSPSGGTSPYTYQWNTGATSSSVTGWPAGNYTVTVTDANNCKITRNFTLTQPAAALNASATSVPVSCYGGSSSVTLTVSGGTAAYSYLWNNGSTANNPGSVPSGNYTVTVTDANSCTTNTSVTVTQPAAALTISHTKTNILCYGANSGSININPAGGTAPYTYLWNNGATSQNITNAAPGNYTVTVTDSKGCSAQLSTTVTQPAAAVSINTTSTDIRCFGENTGIASASANGGTPGYTWLWNNGSTASSISNLAAGNYTVTVTDANNCKTTATITLNQPAAALSATASGTNVNCYGNASGTASVSVSGGTSPYTYNWSNGAATPSISNLVSGIYSVTVTDSKGCTSTGQVNITQPAAVLTSTMNVVAVNCHAGSTGSATVNVNGGTSPYTYSWSNGGTGSSINNIIAGNYTVTITDNKGCTTVSSGSVTQPAAALSINGSAVHIACYGAANGSASVSATGGTTPYSYAWSNGSTASTISSLAPNTYTITVTDSKGCKQQSSVTITQPAAPLTLSATHSDVACNGVPIGSVNLSVSGGTSPYQYNWSNGSSQEDITNLAAGTYTVTVTDAYLCTAVLTRTVSQPAGALNVTCNVTNVNCYGGSNGILDITAVAGTAPYTYLWNNGSTQQDLNNIPAGSYTVTVTDNNGCSLINTLFISQPIAELSGDIKIKHVDCHAGLTGSLDVTAAGGTSPYTYNWNTGAVTQDLNNIPSGNYSVTITDAKGCILQLNATVQQPNAPLSFTSVIDQPDCHDKNDGTINITATGGTTPYNYNWSNGSTTEDLASLAPGTYTLIVTDENNCQSTQSFTIAFTADALQPHGKITNVACHGDQSGAIDLTITGGTSPFMFVWAHGSTSEDHTDLAAGTYTVIITDVNGCTAGYTGTVHQPAASLSSSQVVLPSLCYGDSTGSVDLSLNGGTWPYSITWSNGSSTEDLLSLQAGTYTATVTDDKKCILNITAVVNGPEAALNASITKTDVACSGENTGAIICQVTGGTTPYNILWNNSVSTPDISNLTSGTYILNITDNNGCAFSETVIIEQPDSILSVVENIQNVDCNGNSSGSAMLQVHGGTKPYNVQWSDGQTGDNRVSLTPGNYSYTVTDAQNCTVSGSITITQPAGALTVTSSLTSINCYGDATGNADITVTGGTLPYTYLWNNGATTEDQHGLTAAVYTLTVTDANNCFATQQYTISQPAAPLTLNPTVTQVACNGDATGNISIVANGGTSPYNFSWDNGTILDNLSNLTAGNYDVLVTDNAGCTATQHFTITEPVAALSSTEAITHVLCNDGNDGSINLTVTGGTSPYNYLWSNGSTDEDPASLAFGTYTVTITDANQCTLIKTVNIQQPAAPVNITYYVRDVACHGENSGMIASGITGGTSPYTYQWNTGSTFTNIGNLAAGIYTLTVTDANGCSETLPVSVSQPMAPVSATVTGQDIECYGDETGIADLTPSGGFGNYTYQWNNGSNTQDLQNIAAGNYTVLVMDQNGCTATANVTISSPGAGLSVNSLISNASCYGAADGNITLNVTGGTPLYTYNWSTGHQTDVINGLQAGTYTVTVTDQNGCTYQYAAVVSQPAAGITSTASVSAADCISGAGGNIYIYPAGGTSPYSFLWNTGSVAQNLLNQNPGMYQVTITDANGCVINEEFQVNDSSSLKLDADGSTTICIGNTVTLVAEVDSTATLQWFYNGNPLNGATSTSFVTPVAGIYTLTATTSCGTYTSNPVEINVRALTNVSVSNNVIICPGESVQLHAGGGTEFSWSPSDGLNYTDISNPVANPAKTTDYTVTVKDQYGCTATANVTVSVVCDTLDIPNGFSPNGDGKNDTFVIDGINNYPGNLLFVYNRWGNLIYKKRDYDNTWDGTSNVNGVMFGQLLPNGTYYFILDLNIDQKPVNGFVVIRK